MAALLEGQSVTAIAAAFKLPKSTVSGIKRDMDPSDLAQIEPEKRARLGDLIERHLTSSLEACEAIAEHATDGRWLAKQSASELAVLYGVMTDKAVRIIEATQMAHGDDSESE